MHSAYISAYLRTPAIRIVHVHFNVERKKWTKTVKIENTFIFTVCSKNRLKKVCDIFRYLESWENFDISEKNNIYKSSRNHIETIINVTRDAFQKVKRNRYPTRQATSLSRLPPTHSLPYPARLKPSTSLTRPMLYQLSYPSNLTR